MVLMVKRSFTFKIWLVIICQNTQSLLLLIISAGSSLYSGFSNIDRFIKEDTDEDI